MLRSKASNFVYAGLVALLLAPLIAIACLVVRVNPIETFTVIWRVLGALRGTNVEFDSYSDAVTVRIV